MRRLTNDQFIAKANDIHNNKYGYDQVNYKNAHTKIMVTCPEHGNFEQEANSHLQGFGCPKCKGFKLSNERKLTKQKFIEKAKSIHGNSYDYSKVEYVNNYTKIIIICLSHGEFAQIPSSHLQGVGCAKCHYEKTSERIKYDTNDFIKRANEVHNNVYTYLKVNYKDSLTKVIITCKDHGDFEQTPANHIAGNGCPICNVSKGELAIKNILDKYGIKYIREYRIPNQIYLFRYDFYLLDYDLLIEFHGKQHYEPVDHFGGEEAFKDQQKRDMFKRELAKELKITLLEFNNKQLTYMENEIFEQFVLSKIKGNSFDQTDIL